MISVTATSPFESIAGDGCIVLCLSTDQKPATGSNTWVVFETDTGKRFKWAANAWEEITSGAAGEAAWGTITGTISAQTDLQTALDSKQASGSYATASHNHDLSYDVLGSASAALSSALAADFDGTWVSLSGKPTTFAPIIGAGATQACAGNDARLSDARTPTAHTQAASTISDSTTTGRAVLTATDAAAARTAIGAGTSSFNGVYASLTSIPSTFVPTVHDILTGHSFPGGTTNFLREDGTWGLPAAGSVSWGGISGTLANQADLQTALDGKSGTGHTHTGVYEPANANIQAHVVSAHAPANAQANADITKAEIEAKLTGVIASHSHAGGSAVIGSARVTADRTTTAATFANITDAAIAIGASETWSFEAYLSVGCNNTGGGQWTITVPAGATVRFQVHGNTSTATAWTGATITTSGANTATMCTANAQGRLCRISGVVVNSTNAGNIQIQHRAITAGQTVTTNANSYITGRKH